MKHKVVLSVLASSFLLAGLVVPFSLANKEESRNQVDKSTQKTDAEAQTISLNFPIKGEETNILRSDVVSYIKAMHTQANAIVDDYCLHDFYVTGGANNAQGEFTNDTDKVRVTDYASKSVDVEKSKIVTLVFDAVGFEKDAEFTVKYGLKQDLSDAKEVKTKNTFAEVSQLYANKTYYWNVTSNGVTSQTESFKTPDGFRMMTVPGVTNVRDFGGRPVKNGKHIKQGLIFRGGELVNEDYTDSESGSKHYANLNDNNKAIMREEMGIAYDVDFRGASEAGNITESPLKDADHDVTYTRIDNMPAYTWFYAKLRDGSFPADKKAGVKDMFMAFKNANEKHVYFHCRGGADRTGTAGFLLGGLLGMSYTDLIIDYELTSFSTNYRPHNITDTSSYYEFPSMIYEIKHLTKPNSSELYWTATKPISQMFEEILKDYFSLTDSDITAIRTNLLED